jgi:uncharacterized protein
MDEATLQRLKDAYRQWTATKGGSIDAWLELMADDFDYGSLADQAPEIEFTTGGKSKDEVRGYFQRLTADWEMVDAQADQFLVDGDTVVVIGSCDWRFKRTGKSAATPKVDIWKFKDGKAVGCFELYDTARAIAATMP